MLQQLLATHVISEGGKVTKAASKCTQFGLLSRPDKDAYFSTMFIIVLHTYLGIVAILFDAILKP